MVYRIKNPAYFLVSLPLSLPITLYKTLTNKDTKRPSTYLSEKKYSVHCLLWNFGLFFWTCKTNFASSYGLRTGFLGISCHNNCFKPLPFFELFTGERRLWLWVCDVISSSHGVPHRETFPTVAGMYTDMWLSIVVLG